MIGYTYFVAVHGALGVIALITLFQAPEQAQAGCKKTHTQTPENRRNLNISFTDQIVGCYSGIASGMQNVTPGGARRSAGRRPAHTAKADFRHNPPDQAQKACPAAPYACGARRARRRLSAGRESPRRVAATP